MAAVPPFLFLFLQFLQLFLLLYLQDLHEQLFSLSPPSSSSFRSSTSLVLSSSASLLHIVHGTALTGDSRIIGGGVFAWPDCTIFTDKPDFDITFWPARNVFKPVL